MRGERAPIRSHVPARPPRRTMRSCHSRRRRDTAAASRRRSRRRGDSAAARRSAPSGRRQLIVDRDPRRLRARRSRARPARLATRSSRIAVSRSVSGAPFSASTRGAGVDSRDLDEQREMRGTPVGTAPPRPRRLQPGPAASTGTMASDPGGSSPLTSRPAVAAAIRSNSSNSRGIASVPSGSNSIAWLGRGRRNRKRSCSAGSTSAIVWAAAPVPLRRATSSCRRC